MSVLQLIVLYVVVFQTVLLALSANGHVAVRSHLTHVDSAHGLTKHDLLRRMVARTRARVDKRWSPPRPQPQPQPGGGPNDTTATAWVSGAGDNPNSEYLIHLGIGTPRPQSVALTLDTGSDLIWTQCACKSCFQQPSPALDTSASSTLRHYSCFDPLCAWGGLALSGCTVNDNSCFYVYSNGGNNSGFTSGKISEDTFTFQAANGTVNVVAVPGLRFGCGMYNTGDFKSNESGIAGFGRGPMSLPSQLKVRSFSYCFTSILDHGNSPVFLGGNLNLPVQATGPIQSTPFVRSPTEGPNSSLYYLSLKGVTVGNKRLPFEASTFALRGDGSGGTIIDSGTAITTFPRAVFRTLREEFVSQVSLPVADVSTQDDDSMLCFAVSQGQIAQYIPSLILHLEGADWELPLENYVMAVRYKTGTINLCVVINSAGDSGGMTTVIGNFQQQNMHIAYDLGSNKLFFVPARCDKL